MTDSIPIRELSRRTGVSAYTLRYYEDAGLMIEVPRDTAGHRAYGADHIRWVGFLKNLREGGLGIGRIRAYAEMTRSGADPDGKGRLEILRAHRDDVRARIDRLTEHLAVLDHKVARGCAPDPVPDGAPEAASS